jgi:dTDP-4-dehydrorhamnose reductase
LPDYCINCAAYTAVDKAETDRELAMIINGEAVSWLADAAARHHTRLIQISTDYVFDGNSPLPLKENDAVGPVNWYGTSKLRGEELAIEKQPETIIIRTSWVYSEFGNNFVKTMIRLMRERELVKVINDQIGTPTYAADLACAILKIVDSSHFIPGIFNYSNNGRISWFEFAVAIRDLLGSSCRVEPISTSEYPTAAKRPHYSLLDKTKIRSTYAVEVPDWKKSLEQCMRNIFK